MRILIYTSEFWPVIGGVQSVVVALARGLTGRSAGRNNIEVTLVTKRAADGFDDRTLPFRVVRRPGLTELVRLLRGADLIHLAGPCLLPMLFGLLLRKPVVVEHHGFQAACPNGLLFYWPTQTVCPSHFMERRYQECLRCTAATSGWVKGLSMVLLTFPRRWLSRHAAANVGVSHRMFKRIALPKGKIIYHGVSDMSATLQFDAWRQSGEPCFAYVGRFVAEKGLALLLEAAKLLKVRGRQFRLKLIGDGPARAGLQEMVEALSLRDQVIFTGYLCGKALDEALWDVAVVVMPTLMEETAGLAVIEQMMSGRLVVVSDIGGLGEVVDGVGLKFATGDVEGLTACLERVIESPALVFEMGQRARSRSLEFFRQERMIDDHVTLYRNLLSNRGRS